MADSAPRVAIVTGSESGIGRATAVALAEQGFDLGITWYREQEAAERTAAERAPREPEPPEPPEPRQQMPADPDETRRDL